MPATFDYDGKAGYIYNESEDKWYQLSGKTDTSGTFEWSGYHTHLSSLTAADHLIAKKGINNYLNPSERDLSIPSPITGSVCVIRQDGSGNTVNSLQIYIGSSWVTVMPSPVGQTDKILKSNGTISLWADAPDATTQVILMMGA